MKESLLSLLGTFGVIGGLVLVFYYLIPAGSAYYLFYRRNRDVWSSWRIQSTFPNSASIRREIRGSLVSVVILSVVATFMYWLVEKGYTRVYWDWDQYGWWYLPLSLIVAILAYDTFFYWLHRFMHWRPVFRYTHSFHHRSTHPTPWAIYAFHPSECLLTAAFHPCLILCLPLHPAVYGVFILHNVVNNVAGHLGFEFLPRWYLTHPLFRWCNVVTHHDLHHSACNANYSLYFNFWDRVMKTNHPAYYQTFQAVQHNRQKKASDAQPADSLQPRLENETN
jgi:sterol desaturase/sphingolipid hydroxylase (fatty acid hydroxylase superfamily)